MFLRLLRWFDDRVGGARFGRQALDRIFPDHWSFMLGEVALYCFISLVATGTYLTFFFEPSVREVTYDGSYAPLQGVEMSAAYRSALDISFEHRAGLVMRQMHHWSALVFLASMTVHLGRVFFTGAYRRPRELNWLIGVTLLVSSIANGFLGYSLLDDLLSGTGLRVAYAITLSIPLLGPDLAFGLFGGEFPAESIIPRFYTLHVLILPAVIAVLLGAHLALVWRQKHTQFPGPGRTEDNIVGSRLWPAYAAKSAGLFFIVLAVLAGLGGLAQINPIWVYGPFRSGLAVTAVSSASQPDWYMGWLDGALRLWPGWEPTVGGYSVPNPFLPAVVLPGLFFTLLYLWPFLEARFTRDRRPHNLLDRARDAPTRAGIGAAVVAVYGVLFLAGSNDVTAGALNIAPERLTTLYRVLVFVAPAVAFGLTRRICRELGRRPVRPVAGMPTHTIVRTATGGYETVPDPESASAASSSSSGGEL